MSERENLSEYLRYLKELAMTYRMAVLCLSQINREGDDKPTLRTLKGTGAIEEMSDHVILLHIVNKDEQFTNSQEPRDAVLDVAKNRFGPVGYFETQFIGQYGRFKD
jgi:replicative DNA helicase